MHLTSLLVLVVMWVGLQHDVVEVPHSNEEREPDACIRFVDAGWMPRAISTATNQADF